MSILFTQVAEDFSRHEFDKTYPLLAENIRWEQVGGQTLMGKASVVASCREAARFLATARVEFHRFRVLLVSGASVVVETLAEYTDPQQVSRVASCDIYEFADDQLVAITSYTIEVT